MTQKKSDTGEILGPAEVCVVKTRPFSIQNLSIVRRVKAISEQIEIRANQSKSK